MNHELIDIINDELTKISKFDISMLDVKINQNIFSTIWSKTDKISIDLPTPRKFQEKLSYFGYYYDDYDSQMTDIWALFSAGLYHIGGHANLTNYSIYKKWALGKTINHVWKVIDFIEDTRVNNYLKNNFTSEYDEIKKIDHVIDEFNKLYLKRPILNINEFSKKFFNDYSIIYDSITSKIQNSETQEDLIKIADFLYKNQIFLPTYSYPYVESHQNSIPYQFSSHPKFYLNDDLNKLSRDLGESWLDMLTKNEKMLKKYQKFAMDLQFDSITIGSERYFEYMSLRNESSLFLKKLRTELRTISNIIDDPNPEDLGFVEMQKAIQAIAAQNTSIQVFEQETERRVAENWAILLDVSESMQLRFSDIKKFTLCLAETANDLNSSGNSWGLFCFNNNFNIIKDNDERYSHHVKARIGGIENRGLSFIADAVLLTSRMMAQAASEKKFIFIITDASATGYDKADEKFQEAVINARKSGINVIGIGIPDLKAKCFTASIPYTSIRKTLANFINSYMEVAASAM